MHVQLYCEIALNMQSIFYFIFYFFYFSLSIQHIVLSVFRQFGLKRKHFNLWLATPMFLNSQHFLKGLNSPFKIYLDKQIRDLEHYVISLESSFYQNETYFRRADELFRGYKHKDML